MKKVLFTFACLFAAAIFGVPAATAQCVAAFNVYQDTTLGAPPSTYIGENLCQPQNMLMVDTVNYTYTWAWGDGTATTAPYPTHTYPAPGNYTITLYMLGAPVVGCNDTVSINATINKTASMYTITFTNPFAIPTGVKQVNPTQFSIFPNPVAERLYIRGLQKGSHTAAIYGVDGSLIAVPAIADDHSLNISTLAAGIYMLKITSQDHKPVVLRFSKNR